MIKIIIADDHEIVRQGLKKIFEKTTDIQVIEEAADSRELKEKLTHTTCDALILDITMPGSNILEDLESIKKQRPKLPVLVLSMHPENQYAVRIIKAGASGYMTKDSTPADIIDAVRVISSGRKYITPTIGEKLAEAITAPNARNKTQPHKNLSDREYQVMLLLAAGKSVKETAKVLYISPKTIFGHRSRILRKMNLKTNADLIHYAIKQGLVDSPEF